MNGNGDIPTIWIIVRDLSASVEMTNKDVMSLSRSAESRHHDLIRDFSTPLRFGLCKGEMSVIDASP